MLTQFKKEDKLHAVHSLTSLSLGGKFTQGNSSSSSYQFLNEFQYFS